MLKGKVQISASKEIYFLGSFAIISFKTLRRRTTSITAKYAENNTYICHINHNNMAIYIHQLKNWTDFQWNEQDFISLLSEVRNLQGKLLGKVEMLGFELKDEANLETLI